MGIIKDPRITKAARGVVCLFAFLSVIGAVVFLFSRDANAGMALAMSIVTFILSLVTIALSFFSKDNFIFSIVGGGVAILQFIMGLILGSTLSISGKIKLLFNPGGYIFATVVLIVMSGLIMGVNLIGIFVKSEQSFIDGIHKITQQSAQPQQQMMQQMQQSNMMGQVQQMQQSYPQPTVIDQTPVYPQQVQQPYPQQIPYPQQQVPYPQQIQPEQQQYQQTDNFNPQ